MKLILDVKTNKKAVKPSKDNVVLYDGKDWYVTTKQELFKEYDKYFADVIAECNAKIKEMNALKVELAKQMLDLQEVVRVAVLKENQ